MPTFVLKKYATEPTASEPPSSEDLSAQASQGALDVKKEALTIEVSSSDSIAKIVAQALYKAMPNIDIVQKESQEEVPAQDSAQVITTEQINHNPVKTLQSLKDSRCVLILNKGFKTAQEEWFLQTLENKGVRTFFTPTGFANHVYGILDRRTQMA